MPVPSFVNNPPGSSDRPPKGRARTKANPKGKREWKLTIPELEEKLNEFFGGIAGAFIVTGDIHCATILAERSPRMVDSWMGLAKVNDGLRRVLEGLATGGVYGAVLSSTLAVALPLMDHHNLIPMKLPPMFAASHEPSPFVPPQDGNGAAPMDAEIVG